MITPRPALDRLMARSYRTESGCLQWTGKHQHNGYSRVSVGSKCDGTRGHEQGHRVVMAASLGHPIPEGMIVRHKCDNPPCFEISHLELGTIADNSRDMNERGRAAFGTRNANHKLTDDVVRQIHAQVRSGVRQVDIARALGVTQTCIYQVVTGKRWTHVMDDSARTEVAS